METVCVKAHAAKNGENHILYGDKNGENHILYGDKNGENHTFMGTKMMKIIPLWGQKC